jgi:hypothetical protein
MLNLFDEKALNKEPGKNKIPKTENNNNYHGYTSNTWLNHYYVYECKNYTICKLTLEKCAKCNRYLTEAKCPKYKECHLNKCYECGRYFTQFYQTNKNKLLYEIDK